MTPAEIEDARAAAEKGGHLTLIAQAYGVTVYQLKKAFDPDFMEKRRALDHKRRRSPKYLAKERAERKSPTAFPHLIDAPRHRATREDIAARLAEVPPDTRTPVQIMLGDPRPGRSALDRERLSR